MADFRRWITALAVLALFAGLASAQIGGGGPGGPTPLTCQTIASGAPTPQLRSEGFTEEVGDIVISCTGGPNLAQFAAIPTTNITVFLNTQVTSRLLGNGTTNASEALLMIDEPGNIGLQSPAGAGWGPLAPQVLCSSPTNGAGPGGCGSLAAAGTPSISGLTYVGNVAGQEVEAQCTTFTNGACTATGTVGPNVFQGVVSGNSVTFFGVPVLPPVTSGISRVFRITNIRGNANGLGGGSAAGVSQAIASISTNGSTALPIVNATQIVGFVQTSLSTSLRNTGNTGGLSVPTLPQCTSVPGSGSTPVAQSVLRFTELFGTAFKTRVTPSGANTGQAGGVTQNVPGGIYYSESNFTSPVPSSVPSNGGFTAGLADFGTRLKAVFNNVPAGVNIFVTLTNLGGSATTAAGAPAGGPGSTSVSTYAQLVVSETSPEVGVVPAVSQTTNSPGIAIAQLAVVNGSATAVWEIVNTNPATNENADFGVFITYTSNVAQNSPPPGTATVSMSYAPTPTQGAFSASAAPNASSSLPIPRFADTSTARNIFTIAICQTALLFPYVTNQAGFDTGLAISNTSTDPFGTGAQAGPCNLNWYGANAPAVLNTGSVASGGQYTTLASTSAPNFQGYMIAVCNFQYAHGFAFISDLGARNLAMGYLAIVLNPPGLTRGLAVGENDAH